MELVVSSSLLVVLSVVAAAAVLASIETGMRRVLATALVAAAGTINRNRRAEFVGELAAIQADTGESGVGYALGTVSGAFVERIQTAAMPVQVEGLSKSFGSTPAVRGVSLDIMPGTITAVVGGAGAGKSTMLRLIAGEEHADSGSIRIGETSVLARGIRGTSAIISGGRVLFDDLTVAQNLTLAVTERRGWITDQWSESEIAARTLARLGSDIDPSRKVKELSRSDRAIVSIGQALGRGAQLVVLDEPTRNMSREGALKILRAVRRLATDDVGVLYVTSHIDEAFETADFVAVLRDGELVHHGEIADTDPESIVRHVVGADLEVAHTL